MVWTVRIPLSRSGYEYAEEGRLCSGGRVACMFGGGIPWLFERVFSSELVSATLASIPSASDGFCKWENGISSEVEDSDRGI